MQEEFHESIKSEVEGEPGTLRMNRKSSIIHEEVGNTSQKSQSIDVDSELKESRDGKYGSPIKEEHQLEKIKTQGDHQHKEDNGQLIGSSQGSTTPKNNLKN